MIATIMLAWLSSRSENLDPWLLYAGTVWVDLAAWSVVGSAL